MSPLFKNKYKPVHPDIVTNITELHKKTKPVKSIEEGEEIAKKLFDILNTTKAGVGLTANQIGINKSVFVVNVLKPMYFINPKVIEHSKEKIFYKESCLSIPQKKSVTTQRYEWVKISADNFKEPILFKGSKNDYKDIADLFSDDNLFECMAVQHEFDHTQGKLIIDNDVNIDPKPVKSEKKYNRNDKVTIKNGSETKVIKFKQYTEELKSNGWILV